MGPVVLRFWSDHEGACLLAGSALVMGAAWLHAAWGYRQGRVRTTLPRGVAAAPPPFLLPDRWDLRELNGEHPAWSAPREERIEPCRADDPSPQP